MNQNFARQFRTLLILGRVLNLPTVWSNCLAGWWLSGGGNVWKLPLLFFGVSALYTVGMFLNDADFDRQCRAIFKCSVGTIISTFAEIPCTPSSRPAR
jgi:4-hydroxybenzoate polyprenyltransferase